MGPADAAETVRVIISVTRPENAPTPPDHEFWARTPPGKRRFLSRRDLAIKYGGDAADIATVANFARSKGLTVRDVNCGRRTVTVSGTVQQVNEAFAVELGRYESDDESYRGREGPLHVPKDIVNLVEAVFGLDNRRTAHRSQGSTGAGITPIDVANLYNFPPTPSTIAD